MNDRKYCDSKAAPSIGLPTGRNTAVYVVSAGGVASVCVAAPASDHALNSYVVPFTTCGVADSARKIPAAPVNVVGVASGPPSSATCKPGGSVCNVTRTVAGTKSRVAVRDSPFGSVTVN